MTRRRSAQMLQVISGTIGVKLKLDLQDQIVGYVEYLWGDSKGHVLGFIIEDLVTCLKITTAGRVYADREEIKENRAGNANAGQGKLIKCYNCNGLVHIAHNCTQPKRPQNSDFFKDKMLLMQAQENGAVLDEEEMLFLAGKQTNTFDADVYDQPVKDLAQNNDNIFQVNECDAFDLDVDDEPTAQSIFMANLSSDGPTHLQAGPSNASILSEIHDLDNAINPSDNNQVEHEIHNEVQQITVIDSTSANMGNSNVIPYEQYLTVNDVSVVPSSAFSVPNDAYVLHDNDAYVPTDPLATKL
ncbi:hypothetical protein Tco_1096361, partial [Tanacetum coccineum]